MTKDDLRSYMNEIVLGFLSNRSIMYNSMVQNHKIKTKRSEGFVSGLHGSMKLVATSAIHILQDMQERDLITPELQQIFEQLVAEQEQINKLEHKNTVSEK